jgi:hypothetical protein
MKTYINEGHIKGDVVEVTQRAITKGKFAAIQYTVLVKTMSRYKDKVNEKNIAVDFWRQDEDKEIESLREDDHIFIWFKLDSRTYEGKFYTSVRGSHYQLLDEPEIKKTGRETIAVQEREESYIDAKQGKLDIDDSEEIPF